LPEIRIADKPSARSPDRRQEFIMTKEPNDFAEFFRKATASLPPYGYQCRLACGPDAQPDRPEPLTRGALCRSQLISVPTGLGKTAAVVLACIWNRVGVPSPQSPIRLPLLVY
jgi:hypothetical protein